MKNLPWKGCGQGQLTCFRIFFPCNISTTADARDFEFCTLSAMWSLSLVMSECSLSGHGQGHVSNFYIVSLENFATASRRYTGDIHNSTVVGLFMTPVRQWEPTRSRHGWVHMFITHCLQLNLQLHTIDLVRTCRISSFYTVVWQLTRFQLTRRIAWSLGDSWASCNGLLFNQLIISFGSLWFYPQNDICSCFMLLAYSQLIKSLRFWK